MQQKPVLSIVIPAYNCAKYIARCLDSLKTVKQIEIIAVDDGSTDETLNILKEYERQMGALRVFHKENGGVSSARNYGIKQCTGQYMAFIDGDDSVDSEKLNHVVYEIKAQNKNLYLVPIMRGDEKDHFFTESYAKKLNNAKRPDEKELYKAVIQGRFNEIATKIFKTDIVLKNHIELDESMFMGEDIMFFIDYLIALSQVDWAYLDIAYYYYYRNNSSVSSNIRKGFMRQEQRKFRHVKKLIEYKNLDAEYSVCNNSFYLHKLIYFVSEMRRNGVNANDICNEISENSIDSDVADMNLYSFGDKFRRFLFLSKNIKAMQLFVWCITFYRSKVDKKRK
ncbi:glycosyltransferase family 2 protein [uncultured Subdoligranulum sp.]|uniref:glycosyltransferase family 2 protein n=1 Tax=uncultured Subdoligranulum sp. TaxID=512298 RepID=UPI0025E18291|nr:glycosyltransferase family 2 protein [uncultured Subdoligranulum sp.]